MLDIERHKIFVFDLDGTIYVGDSLLDGVKELLLYLSEKGVQVFFITNNSSKTREQVFQKLIKLGIQTHLDCVINASYALSVYLRDNLISSVYCMGTDDFKFQLNNLGIDIRENNPQAIVIGYDPDFNYTKLEKAIKVYKEGIPIIVTNKERIYPRDNGIISPGAGPAVVAFEYAVEKVADVVIGKPSVYMLEMLVKNIGIVPEQMVVIGDSYESDVNMAKVFSAYPVYISTVKRDDCDTYVNMSEFLMDLQNGFN